MRNQKHQVSGRLILLTGFVCAALLRKVKSAKELLLVMAHAHLQLKQSSCEGRRGMKKIPQFPVLPNVWVLLSLRKERREGFYALPIRINLRTDEIKKRWGNGKAIPQFPVVHKLPVSLSRWEIM